MSEGEYSLHLRPEDRASINEILKGVPEKELPPFVAQLAGRGETPQLDAAFTSITETVQTRIRQKLTDDRDTKISLEDELQAVLETPIDPTKNERMWTVYAEQLLSAELIDLDSQREAMQAELQAAQEYFDSHQASSKATISLLETGNYTADISQKGVVSSRIYEKKFLDIYDRLVKPSSGNVHFPALKTSLKQVARMKQGKGVTEDNKELLRSYLYRRKEDQQERPEAYNEMSARMKILILTQMAENVINYPLKGTSPKPTKPKSLKGN